MKKTVPLLVQTDKLEPEKIYIHPNDGFDLKLFSLSYKLRVFSNCTAEDFNKEKGHCDFFDVVLSNDQPPGKIKINEKYWEKLEKPDQVILINNSNKILVLKVK